MLYKRKITFEGEITPFDMPVFKKTEERKTEQSSLSMKFEELEQQAYQKGFEAGQKAGFAMGEAKAKVLIERIENLLNELIEFKRRLLTELQPQVIELAIAIAEKVILKELEEHPEQVVEIAKEGLMRLERQGKLTIKINPKLKEIFEKHRAELLKLHPDIVFDIDPSLSVYEAVVMSSSEEITTDINEQLRNLIKEMFERTDSD